MKHSQIVLELLASKKSEFVQAVRAILVSDGSVEDKHVQILSMVFGMANEGDLPPVILVANALAATAVAYPEEADILFAGMTERDARNPDLIAALVLGSLKGAVALDRSHDPSAGAFYRKLPVFLSNRILGVMFSWDSLSEGELTNTVAAYFKPAVSESPEERLKQANFFLARCYEWMAARQLESAGGGADRVIDEFTLRCFKLFSSFTKLKRVLRVDTE